MLISKLKTDLNGNILKWQKIILECNTCKIQQRGNYNDLLVTAENILEKWICRACKSSFPAKLEYLGPEIVSDLKRNKKGLLITMQRINVKCCSCHKIINTDYYSHKKYMLKKSKCSLYKCQSCIVSENTTARNKLNAGKTYEELYGPEKAKHFRQQLTNLNKQNPSRYQKMNEFNKGRTGKSHIEVYGRERAEEIYKACREGNKNKKITRKYGPDNPQFGKPASEFSGRGWKGHYKGVFFRSLMELSFIVNYLNANNIKWDSGEQKKHIIPYVSTDNRNRNYFPDFITETEIIEIKPSRLLSFGNNINKKEAAIEFAKQMNKQFKIYTEKDFRLLSKIEVYDLEQTGDLVFTTKGNKRT
jgi:hypothetical protein